MTSRLPVDILEIFRNEPARKFVVLDITQMTGGNPDAVRKVLSRLTDDGSIIRVDHGLYQYNPVVEDSNLHALAKYGYWRIENLRFVTKTAQGGVVSQPSDLDEDVDANGSDPLTSLQGFPWKLPTGQEVVWGEYITGKQEIRISANKSCPFNPDHVLSLLYFLEQNGFEDEEWVCNSIEVNVEGRKWRVDGSYSVLVIKGLMLKVYQHGPNLRMELAFHPQIQLKEVMSFMHAFVNGFDGAEALKISNKLEIKVDSAMTMARIAVSISERLEARGLAKKKSKQYLRFKQASLFEQGDDDA